MKKDRLIKEIHKILFVYESGDFNNYYGYLSNLIVEISGLESDDVILKSLRLLCGLRNLRENITHEDVRRTVLRIMNNIDRGYVDGDIY